MNRNNQLIKSLNLFYAVSKTNSSEGEHSMNVTTFYGSARRRDNSELLAALVFDELKVNKVFLQDYQILPLQDAMREKSVQTNQDAYPALVQEQLVADRLFFITPVYWYGISGLLKTYIDRRSQLLRDPETPDFCEKMKNKPAYLIIVGGDRPALKAWPIIQQMIDICAFLQMDFRGYLIGQGNKRGEVFNDQSAVQQARLLNRQLKSMVHKANGGTSS
jgi:NAD(P)H-dependent FMN reductase